MGLKLFSFLLLFTLDISFALKVMNEAESCHVNFAGCGRVSCRSESNGYTEIYLSLTCAIFPSRQKTMSGVNYLTTNISHRARKKLRIYTQKIATYLCFHDISSQHTITTHHYLLTPRVLVLLPHNNTTNKHKTILWTYPRSRHHILVTVKTHRRSGIPVMLVTHM